MLEKVDRARPGKFKTERRARTWRKPGSVSARSRAHERKTAVREMGCRRALIQGHAARAGKVKDRAKGG